MLCVTPERQLSKESDVKIRESVTSCYDYGICGNFLSGSFSNKSERREVAMFTGRRVRSCYSHGIM